MLTQFWLGRTVACIASGPSLTVEDCAFVERAGLPTIAINTSWKRARFANIIYAGDACWWDANVKEIDISAQLWSGSRSAQNRHGINLHESGGSFNSGMRAIQLAIDLGAAKIILLGYDCTVKYGTHWHGNHIKTKNPNATKCNAWKKQFAQLAKNKCEIINCSRVTALECFVQKSLEEALC